MSTSSRMEAVLKSLDKAYEGEICSVKEWDTKVIPRTVKAMLKKFDLEKTNKDVRLAVQRAKRRLREVGY